MNKTRRKAIEALASQIEELKEQLTTIQEEETEYYDNMPESFQGGEKGELSQAAIDSLESAAGSLEEVIEYLTSAVE